MLLDLTIVPFDEPETPHLLEVVLRNDSSVTVDDSGLLVLERWSADETAEWVEINLIPQDGSGPGIPIACGPDLRASGCSSETAEQVVEAGQVGEPRKFRLPQLESGTFRVRPLFETSQAISSTHVEVP